MKFNTIIGNPPYQNNYTVNSKPIYHLFMNLSYKLSDRTIMITPGRFLFDAGRTPSKWNKQMLNDPKFKVVWYSQNAKQVFNDVKIKGGLVISLRSNDKSYGKIGVFTAYRQLKMIVNKTNNENTIGFNTIVSKRGPFKFSKTCFRQYPNLLKDNKGNRSIESNAFKRFPYVFTKDKPNNKYVYIKLLGRLHQKRVYRYIRKDFVENNKYINKYQVIVPQANGSGSIGEKITTIMIGYPIVGDKLIGTTDTYLNIGPFDTKFEATAALKYIKTKFSRTLLGVKKTTQQNSKKTWKLIPIQDFTKQSNIDWEQSVDNIDKQLYKKYKLDNEEIKFIEDNIKRME